jgi:hypothetical protein
MTRSLTVSNSNDTQLNGLQSPLLCLHWYMYDVAYQEKKDKQIKFHPTWKIIDTVIGLRHECTNI